MGDLDSAAAAAITTAARLVADAYMAAPADVAVAPAAAAGPVSYVVWTCFVPTCMNLYGFDLYELVWTRPVLVWTKQEFICICVSNACDAYSDT